jgi:tetratricopeptide (TPR) repeat protein
MTADTTSTDTEEITIPDLESRMDITSDSDDESEPATLPHSLTLPFTECVSKAASFKDAGNAAFKNKDFPMAQKCYQDGIDLLLPHKDVGGPSDAVSEEQYETLISTYVGVQGNLGLLHFKQEEWTAVVKTTVEVLKYDDTNVKALYRRGVAHRRLNCLQESKEILSRVVELDPTNAPAKKELTAVIKEIKAQKQKEKSALAGAFSSGSMYNDKEKERELKLKRAREAEEKLQDDYVKSKLKRRQEGKDEQTFDEYKAELKKEKEAREKEEEEERKKKAPPVSSAPKKSPSASKVTPQEDDEEEYDEEEQKILKEAKSKGYCYFKNKLDDETSQLIGDITPKATQSVVPEQLATTPSTKVEASSWNHAGTWEERDVSAITKTRLTETCLGTTVSLASGLDDSSLNDTLASLQSPDSSSGDTAALTKSIEKMSSMMSKVHGSITEVKKLDGEAQIVMVGQGKKRQVYDFNLTLKFEVTVEDITGDASKNKTYKGSFEIMDVAPGADYEHKTIFKKLGANNKVDSAVAQLRESALSRIHSFFANDYLNL